MPAARFPLVVHLADGLLIFFLRRRLIWQKSALLKDQCSFGRLLMASCSGNDFSLGNNSLDAGAAFRHRGLFFGAVYLFLEVCSSQSEG
jgi:hypothetical protein